ncbi:MAG TPA: hypothetical protein V6D14_04200 [Coleofasciculaceae cyanobacterium]|jgi:hypothetical protein
MPQVLTLQQEAILSQAKAEVEQAQQTLIQHVCDELNASVK